MAIPLPDRLQLVLDALKKFSHPVSLAEVHRTVPTVVSSTLRRRLQWLAKAGFVEITGTRKGTRYAYIKDDSSLPLSTEGRKIRHSVRQPITKRRPIGYDRTFLDSYSPNETF